MTPSEIKDAVRTLQAQGQSLREISRGLKLSRNTVRRILRHSETRRPATEPALDALTRERLEHAFERARGNAARVQQLLAEEHALDLPYSCEFAGT